MATRRHFFCNVVYILKSPVALINPFNWFVVKSDKINVILAIFTL